MFMASSLLRPHLAFRIQRSKMDKDAALTNEMLDSYLKDVLKSTLFFFFACPIMVYKIYIKKEEVFQETSGMNDLQAPQQTQAEDRAATLLRQAAQH